MQLVHILMTSHSMRLLIADAHIFAAHYREYGSVAKEPAQLCCSGGVSVCVAC